jgi:hypothetical protein
MFVLRPAMEALVSQDCLTSLRKCAPEAGAGDVDSPRHNLSPKLANFRARTAGDDRRKL